MKKNILKKIVTSLVTVLLNMFMYLLCTYKKSITVNLFKINTLNFTMYIFTILRYPLKTYVIRLHHLISMNIFFPIKDHSFSL